MKLLFRSTATSANLEASLHVTQVSPPFRNSQSKAGISSKMHAIRLEVGAREEADPARGRVGAALLEPRQLKNGRTARFSGRSPRLLFFSFPREASHATRQKDGRTVGRAALVRPATAIFQYFLVTLNLKIVGVDILQGRAPLHGSSCSPRESTS